MKSLLPLAHVDTEADVIHKGNGEEVSFSLDAVKLTHAFDDHNISPSTDIEHRVGVRAGPHLVIVHCVGM